MQNRRRSSFLLGIIIFLVVGPLEASIVVDRFEGTGETLDSFILQLGDEHEGIRQGAVAAIERLAVADDRIVLAWSNLTRLLGRGRLLGYYLLRWNRTTDTVFRLIDLDKALAGLLDSLKSDNRDESILARFAIKEIADRLRNATLEPLPGTVPLLVGALQDEDVHIREIVSQLLADIPSHALATIPSEAKAAVPKLITVLTDESEDVRSAAVSTLGQIAVGVPTVQPEITETLMDLTDKNEDVRSAIVSALGDIAVATPGVQLQITEKLIELLNTPNFVIYRPRHDRNFHVDVARVLASIGPAAVPSLLKALNATDAGVRHHAAIALADIRSQTDEAIIPIIPILTEALASPYLHTRDAAVWALTRLGERPTLVGQIAPIFVKVLQTTIDTEPIYYDLTFHDIVADALAAIDLSEIIKILRSENPYVQRPAVAAIALMSDPAVDEAVPIVIELLCSDDRYVRQAAVETLIRLRQFSTDDLIAALTDENGCVRTRSAIVLVEMGPQAIAVLAETLPNQSPETNRQIIEIL